MIAAIALAVVAAAPSAAPATSGHDRVSVVALCDDEAAITPVASRLAAALATQGWRVSVAPEPGAPARPCLVVERRQARAAVEAGVALFEGKLRHDAARLRLEEGLGLFAATQAMLDVELYAQAHFFLAWIALETSQAAAADEHLTAVQAAAPSWSPDRKRFPPHVVAAWHAAQKRARAQARATLVVKSEPIGAAVVVDGVARCEAPCALTELAPGEHFVEVARAGRSVARRRLVLVAGQKAELPLTLVSDPREDAAAALAAQRDVTAHFGGAPAVLLTPRGDEVLALVARPGVPAQRVSLAASQAAAGEAEVVALLGPPAAPAEPLPPLAPTPSVLATLHERWWFWAAIGAAALGGAAAAISASRDDVRVTVRP